MQQPDYSFFMNFQDKKNIISFSHLLSLYQLLAIATALAENKIFCNHQDLKTLRFPFKRVDFSISFENVQIQSDIFPNSKRYTFYY